MQKSKKALIGCLAFLMVPLWAHAQDVIDDEVKVIPYSQRDPRLPHPAHSNARVTLKAMVRNATCNTYRVWWDANRDGNYDNDPSRDVSRNDSANAVLDIGRNFQVPDVSGDTSLNINVRVRNNCTNAFRYATYRMFVYDFIPSNDPRNWTDEQLEIMTQMGIQEGLWHMHRTMKAISGSDTQLEAHDWYSEATGMTLWAFTINGHLPAYPPQHMGQFDAALGAGTLNTMGADFLDSNSERWHNDPYAETAMRFANYLARRGGLRQPGGGAQEDTTCGYNADGSNRNCNRIPGTANGQGAYANGSANVYRMGVNLGGLATVLPALAGTPVRNGGVAGNSWEFYIQEMVDTLGAQQIDGGCSEGGWIYGDWSGAAGCNISDASTSQWAYIGLESAEIAGGSYGVIVNNLHKYRIATNLINNQRGDGGAGYRSNSGRGDFKLTGGSMVGARWLGIHRFNSNDGARAFADSGFSRGRLRQSYDAYLSHLANNWNNSLSVGSHWGDSMWRTGDMYCGNYNAVYNAGRCGSTYAMYSLQKGFRTGQPELLEVGNHDWVREFNTYYLRAQNRYADNNNPWSNYDLDGSNNNATHGRIRDSYCDNHQVTCVYGSGRLAQPMGSLVLTPAIFNPKPIAIGEVQPQVVTEGCAGANSGLVTFDHSESFHPNPESRIVAYRWDVNAANGLWWDGDGDPDFETPDDDGNFSDTFEFRYPNAGNYTATLQVVDNTGQIKTTTVTVQVVPAENLPPSVAHGGPYEAEAGAAQELNGSATDQNLDCGDSLNVVWFIDGDNQPDAQGVNPTIPWAVLQNLDQNAPNRIRIRATDESGESADAETTLRIYPREPLAVGRAEPNPAACQQNVTFIGSESSHPNPNRSIAQYDWDIDSDGASDGGGERFTGSYDRFGNYTVTLTVTDDLGRSDSVEFPVAVNQGNQSPVARIAEANYVVLEGDDLVLDGRGSSDANEDCGDDIVSYEWDLDGDGQFDDAAGANPTVPWATVESALDWPADRDTGEPANVVTLRVTDSFGATHTVTTSVAVYTARPTAIVTQSPNPSAIGQRTGRAVVTLDGRESFSPVPGNTIEQYQWVFDPDNPPQGNVNPDSTDPATDFQKVFDLPLQEGQIPPVKAYLRVTDNTGRSSLWVEYDVAYDIPPTPPTADADPTDPPEEDYHLLIGEGVILDGSQSFDPDPEDSIALYQWDLDAGDDFQEDLRRNADEGARSDITAEELAGFGIDAPGAYPIILQVTDNFGLTGRDDAVVNVYAVNPEATFTVNPNPAACGAQINLDASQCFHPHPDIEIVSWEWDINGNGNYDDDADARGMMTTARFSEFTFGNERKTVNLRVTDSRDNATEVAVDIEVNLGNRAPAPVAGGFRATADAEIHTVGTLGFEFSPADLTVAAGDIVEFQMPGNHNVVEVSEATYNAGGNQPLANGFEVGFGQTRRITFDRPGTYYYVCSPHAGMGMVGTITVESADGAVIGPYAISPGESVTFSNAGTTDPDEACGDEVVSCSWDINRDGRGDFVGNSREFSWAELQALGIDGPSENEIRVTCTDRFGATGTATARLLVVDGPTAVATANPNRTGCSANVTFSAENSTTDGPDGQGFDIARYEWDFDGDGQFDDAVGAVVTRAAVALPGNDGSIRMTARVRVVDASGRSDTTEVSVEIDSQNLAPVADAGGPYSTGPVGNSWLAVRLDGRGSSDPNQPCDDLVVYKWDVDGDGRYGTDGGDDDPVGMIVEGFINPDWQVNTVQTIRLIVCDGSGACSQPSEGEIAVLDEAPPIGELVSPRAEDNPCFGNDAFDVQLRVSDPAGDRVFVTVYVADEVVGETEVDTPDDGSSVDVSVRIDPRNDVAEGRQSLDVFLEDENGGSAELTAGGRILFDRTAPVVSIGNQLREGVCYNPGQVPEPEIDVEDADNNPSISRTVEETGCGRTLVVTATDSCGNEGVGRRPYLIAQPVDLTIDGPADGELVRQAIYNWAVVGPAECASRIESNVSRAGGGAQPYAEGAAINDPGEYTLNLAVANCNGASRGLTRNFIVNGPPVAISVPNGHPARVPGEVAYQVAEGGGLQVDASESRPPEAADSIARYQWDWTGDGIFDAEGVTANYPTDEDGVFNARLTVTDSLGLSGEQGFRVTVTDVDPTADPGGPYTVPQGVELQVDGRGSVPGSAADPIDRYVWEWDDNTANGQGAQPTHTYLDNGTYSVRLTVHDEDSSHSAIVRVEVRDVDPVVNEITTPEQTYEIARMNYEVDAVPGAPGDPITRYEWDFDGDGTPEHAGADASTVAHQFHDAGRYNLIITVLDGDSQFQEVRPVEVREITLLELIEFIEIRMQEGIATAQADGNVQAGLALIEAMPNVARAKWGENNGYRGNTLLGLEPMARALSIAQSNGMNYGLELWALSRQMHREVTRQRAAALADNADMANDPSIARADALIEDIESVYLDANFKDDVAEADGGVLATRILDRATDAFYWVTDATDPCYVDGRFPVPDPFGGPRAISAAAEPVNASATVAMTGLRDAMVNYRNAAGAQADPGPGVDATSDAINSMGPILDRIALPITFPCPEGVVCVTDLQALEMELQMMELVDRLVATAGEGVWVRNWQACLTNVVKFRIEISLLRVEDLCGANVAYIREARQMQSVGLSLFDEGNYPAALEYYNDDERRCSMIDIYNRCITVQVRLPDADGNLTVRPDRLDVPNYCEEEEEGE